MVNLDQMSYNIGKTPIPQVTKSCLSQPNKLSLSKPSLGWLALGLESLATDPRGLFYFPVKERLQKMITQNQAISMVKLAIKAGKLTRLDQCEICTKKPMDYKVHSIVAHHWNGYDDPLNVWWVCRSCNGLLLEHDGSLNKEQARILVRKRQRAKLGYYDSPTL